jgi:hypothetical protein
VQIPHMMTN